MNRNLQGEILTAEELTTIAETNGLLTEHERNRLRGLHGQNLQRSALIVLTREACFNMFMRGELILDTSNRTPAEALANRRERNGISTDR